MRLAKQRAGILTVTAVLGAVECALGWFPYKAAVLGWACGAVLMIVVGEPLAAWLSRDRFVREDPPRQLTPEQPVHCQTCGGSLYLVDRDDNGMCDECWAKAEKVSFDEQRDRQRRIATGGF